MNNPSAYDATEWFEQATCGEYGSPSMFPSEGDERGIAAAKAVCASCPVIVECLKGALARGEQWGVWGGMTPDERKAFRRKQQRGAQLVSDQSLPGVA